MSFEASGFGFGLKFGKSDAAEYADAIKHVADRQLDATRDTNATSTKNLGMMLRTQERSELRWMDFMEDSNDEAMTQNGNFMRYFALTSGSPLAALFAFNDN